MVNFEVIGTCGAGKVFWSPASLSVRVNRTSIMIVGVSTRDEAVAVAKRNLKDFEDWTK